MQGLNPYSAAAERNSKIIFDTLAESLESITSVLEIGSGTGQHALYASNKHTSLEWQCSDVEQNIQGLTHNLQTQKDELLPAPIHIDVNTQGWQTGQIFKRKFDAIYSANTLHIMDSQTVENFFKGITHAIHEQGHLFLYGPFKMHGEFTSQSNAEFDQNLRSRGCGSAIRDIEWICELATNSGFRARKNIAMPANNHLIWFNRTSS